MVEIDYSAAPGELDYMFLKTSGLSFNQSPSTLSGAVLFGAALVSSTVFNNKELVSFVPDAISSFTGTNLILSGEKSLTWARGHLSKLSKAAKVINFYLFTDDSFDDAILQDDASDLRVNLNTTSAFVSGLGFVLLSVIAISLRDIYDF
jgi:hypothetical protein